MRRDVGQRRHRLVGQQRQHEAGEDEELAGGDDFLGFDAPRQAVQLLARSQQQNRGHRGADGNPRRFGERRGADQIRQHVADRNHQAAGGRALGGRVARRGANSNRRAKCPARAGPRSAAGNARDRAGRARRRSAPATESCARRQGAPGWHARSIPRTPGRRRTLGPTGWRSGPRAYRWSSPPRGAVSHRTIVAPVEPAGKAPRQTVGPRDAPEIGSTQTRSSRTAFTPSTFRATTIIAVRSRLSKMVPSSVTVPSST